LSDGHPEPGGYVFVRETSSSAALPPPIEPAFGTNDLGDLVGVAEPIDVVATSACIRSDGVVTRLQPRARP
jgi:hypothetical protein